MDAAPAGQEDAMSQRASGYERQERDTYETPEWVTQILIPHIRWPFYVWEPAAGSGKMVRALVACGYIVEASDIADGRDFLESPLLFPVDAIITNPPFELATAFIEHALELMRPSGAVAMLLRTDFDHAKTRAHLFAGCPAFAKKVVLTKRIVWFERKGAAPSFNHAWYIWDWRHEGPPTVAYGPNKEATRARECRTMKKV
jgi:hypothetical protein